MGLIKKEISRLVSVSTGVFTTVANTELALVTGFLFNFQKMVKVKSIFLSARKFATPVYVELVFLDNNNNYLQDTPIEQKYGIAVEPVVPRVPLTQGLKVDFENLYIGGAEIGRIISTQAVTDGFLTISFEILEEKWVDENQL